LSVNELPVKACGAALRPARANQNASSIDAYITSSGFHRYVFDLFTGYWTNTADFPAPLRPVPDKTSAAGVQGVFFPGNPFKIHGTIVVLVAIYVVHHRLTLWIWYESLCDEPMDPQGRPNVVSIQHDVKVDSIDKFQDLAGRSVPNLPPCGDLIGLPSRNWAPILVVSCHWCKVRRPFIFFPT
jgi:hypothetical protein